MTPPRYLVPIAPKPPRPPSPVANAGTCFYDLPPELRIEIYKSVLENVVVYIPPAQSNEDPRSPHAGPRSPHTVPRSPHALVRSPLALVRTSRQVRHEVLPIIHAHCAITAQITDFNFQGLLNWMQRISPNDQRHLLKNPCLKIELRTTDKPPGQQEGVSLRRWLALRADKIKPQAKWEYSGPNPHSRVKTDLRRRVKRMTENGKKAELKKMARTIGVDFAEGD